MQRLFTPEKEASLLKLYLRGNISQETIADGEGVSQPTVARALARAKREAQKQKRRDRDARRKKSAR